MSNLSLVVFTFVLGFGGHQAAKAETISAQRIRNLNRLLPLKKLTVGPDDQYFAAPSPNGRFLVFTRKSDLVAQLRMQDLATGEVKELLPPTADSQEATFAGDGRLAFNYFRFNARGDVCWAKLRTDRLETLKESEVNCLKRPKDSTSTQRSNPFWKSRDELGYLERAVGAATARIVSENIETGARTVLAEGKIWSPSMREGGRLLAYNKLQGGLRRLAVKAIPGGEEIVINLALPGMSGFPILSEDEKTLYFSHFINDTNSDHTIDGSDNAVIFRLPIAQATKAGTEVFPEQLTSVGNSCSFPIPFQESVFVTCAFEGSLDLYQMPATGVVPIAWIEQRLGNAIDSARSYQDRILLWNTQKYRSVAAASGKARRLIDEKLLSDHIFAGDTTAALYYLERLALATSDRVERDYYGLLAIYLHGLALKQAQPTGEVTREFRALLMREDAKIDAGGAPKYFKQTVRAWFREFLDERKAAADLLKQIRLEGKIRPLERIVHFDLAESYAARSLPGSLAQMSQLYQAMLNAPELDEQARLFYGFHFLKRLGETMKDRAERMALIEKTAKGAPEKVALLFHSEIAVLKIIDASAKAEKFKAYSALDKLMVASKADYFLRRSLYVRAITNFADASEFQFMGFVGDNWLKYTAGDDTEFTFAREFFAVSALDRAYDAFARKEFDLAASYFYQALSVTDDLEGHWGYVRAMVAGGKRATIDARYENLQAQKLVDDNMKFVRAALALVDGEEKAAKDPGYTGHLDAAISQLKTMETDRDSSMRHLVMGFCYLEKLLRSANGLEFDTNSFQESNRSLMLAYDLGRDNDRIKAAALMDLGILHMRVQNHGLAARFFQLRKRLPFLGDQERAGYAWLAARALEFSHQPAAAAKELEEIPTSVRSTPIDERQAYELAFAGKYPAAASMYHKILSANAISDPRNLAAANLTYGFALLKSQKPDQAAAALRASLAASSNLKASRHGRTELIDFEPLRGRLAAAGLLAQATTGAERVSALAERGRLLEAAQGILDEARVLRIQNSLQLAEALRMNDSARATASIKEALKWTEEYADKNQYLGNAVFRATVAGLVDASRNPTAYSADDAQRIEKLSGKCLSAYQAQKNPDPVLSVQRIKISLLRAAFLQKQGKSRPDQLKSEVTALMAAPESLALKNVLPPAGWNDLERLAAGVQLF